jgi:hypothetical protein
VHHLTGVPWPTPAHPGHGPLPGGHPARCERYEDANSCVQPLADLHATTCVCGRFAAHVGEILRQEVARQRRPRVTACSQAPLSHASVKLSSVSGARPPILNLRAPSKALSGSYRGPQGMPHVRTEGHGSTARVRMLRVRFTTCPRRPARPHTLYCVGGVCGGEPFVRCACTVSCIVSMYRMRNL